MVVGVGKRRLLGMLNKFQLCSTWGRQLVIANTNMIITFIVSIKNISWISATAYPVPQAPSVPPEFTEPQFSIHTSKKQTDPTINTQASIQGKGCIVRGGNPGISSNFLRKE